MRDEDFNKLKRNVEYEIGLIDGVIADLKETMKFQKDITSENVTTAQKGGIATLLMNFYNGIENILKQIGKIYYQEMPKGEGWHKALLKQSWMPPVQKEAVFREEISDKLYEYLSFRHLFFHGYGFKLEWDRLVILTEGVYPLWQDVKKDIRIFLIKIEKLNL